MAETIQEFVDSDGLSLRLDRPASVLRGVKLLGMASRNGRRYRERALREAMPLYNGAKVNVNHAKGDPLAPRDYQDRVGVIRNVEYRAGDGLFGALHFNPKHALAEQLIWDAEHAPENVGFSHNVLARTSRKGEITIVEGIDHVQSVDLVADPATTRGLFEEIKPTHAEWDALTLEQLALHRPDLLRDITESYQNELDERDQRIDRLETAHATDQRWRRVLELLSEHQLPLPGSTDVEERRKTSEPFVATLIAAPDEATVEQLVADRAKAVISTSNSQAVSREQDLFPEAKSLGIENAADFVAAISSQ